MSGLNLQGLSVLAAEGAAEIAHVSGWFLSNAWIIPAIPAASFFAILFFGKRLPRGGSELGIIAVGASLVLALCTVGQWISAVNVAGGAAVEPVVNRWTWWVAGGVDFTIGTLVDGLAVALLFVVTTISLLVHIYSTDYVAGDVRYTHFFAFLSLFTAAMLFFVLAENTIQMIVGWELVGVCSFVLIGHWWEEKPNSDAALKAFLTNRVGDIGLLVGVSVLFFAAGGTFSILEINTKAVDGEIGHTVLLISALCLLAAVISKSGQFFLHTWLPDAMAGPTPVSALIHAATMVRGGRLPRGAALRGVLRGHGHRRVVHQRPGAHRRDHHPGRRLAGVRAERHQAGAGLFHDQPAGLHGHGAGGWRLDGGDLPPLHARLLQGLPVPGLGLGQPRGAQLRHEEGHGRAAPPHAHTPTAPS